jgi:hypothetical protein
VAQTGHPVEDWRRVIVKELVDNGLDRPKSMTSHQS